MHNVGILLGSGILSGALVIGVIALVYRRPPPQGLPSLALTCCIILFSLLGARCGLTIGFQFHDPYGFEPVYGAINGWLGGAIGSLIGYPIGKELAMQRWHTK